MPQAVGAPGDRGSDDESRAADRRPTRLPTARGQTVRRVRAVVAPIPRTGAYYARSWGHYLARRGGEDIPVARPTLGLASQAFVDEIVLVGFRVMRQRGDTQELERIERETNSAVEFAQHAGWTERPATFFEEPPPLADLTIRPASSRRQQYEHLSFASGYEPRHGEPGRRRWLSYTANGQVHAWMLRHPTPRPWLICVHGTSMGRPWIDLPRWRARWMHEVLGLNVVMPVLPLHGPRRLNLPGSAVLPGEDVLNNVHATAQAVWDIRRLITWIRSQDGESPVGISGISLGGYITSLVASTQSGLACAIAGVPVVDLLDLLQAHATGYHDHIRRITRPAKLLSRMISPLSLEPLVPFEGRFIYAGLADQLVHPRKQVQLLWQHWGRPQIEWYPGGHTGFFRSKPVQLFLLEALVQSGLVDRAGLAEVESR